MNISARRFTTFGALYDRNFRWYWLATLASSATFQMTSVGQGWLVYELAGSALALGWVGAAWSITNSLVSPGAGVLSDRMEQRALILWMRGLLAFTSMITSFLIWRGVVAVWHLAFFSLIRGVLYAILMPAQNAYLAKLVGPKALLNALSLNSIGMGLSGIVAASLAGYMVDKVGIAAVFLVITVLYMVVFGAILQVPRTIPNGGGSRRVWSDLLDGARYLRVQSILIPLLGLVFVRGLLGMPYSTLMPKYAQDVMGLDASGLGILVAAPGAGSLISSFVMASIGDYRHKGRLMLMSGAVMGLGLVLFANIPAFFPVLVMLALVGAMSNISMLTNHTLLQNACDPGYLGRVMSFYMLMFALTQMGTIPIGAFADQVGVPLVVTFLGAALVITSVLVWVLVPRVKSLP
jgi:MFS family permease